MATLVDHPLKCGVETLGLKVNLGDKRPPDALLADFDRRSSRVAVTYSPRTLPSGVSFFGISHSPQGFSANGEVNLTTVLYGYGSEVGSLSVGEVPLALRKAITTLYGFAPGYLPWEEWRWDISRFDPSTTLLTDRSPSEVVEAVHAVWSGQRWGKERLYRIDSGALTATHVISRHRSRSVYDKTADAARLGKYCPPGALRLESRIRTSTAAKKGSISEVFPASTPEVLVSRSVEEIRAFATALPPVMHTAAVLNVRTLVDAQRRLGEERNTAEAVELMGIAQLLAGTGDIWRLTQEGYSQATAYRRRARLAQLVAASDPDLTAETMFSASDVLLARQLADELMNRQGS